MNLRIRVTANDIKKGCRRQNGNCPIARAIKRNKGVYGVSVGVTDLSYFVNDTYHFAPMPKMAQLFIREFDDGCPVEPFEFTVESKGTPTVNGKAPNNDSFP